MDPKEGTSQLKESTNLLTTRKKAAPTADSFHSSKHYSDSHDDQVVDDKKQERTSAHEMLNEPQDHSTPDPCEFEYEEEYLNHNCSERPDLVKLT